jgi:hypothetical protein
MQACWQAEPLGEGGTGTVDAVLLVVVVVVVVVLVVSCIGVTGVHALVIPWLVVVVVEVVEVDVVLDVVVDVVVVVVLVVGGAEQGHDSSRRHWRRALFAARTARRPHCSRACALNSVQERPMEIRRVRPHLFSALIVSVQLPGLPGASSAQMLYWVLMVSVRACRASIRASAAAQPSTTESVWS